MKSTRAEDGRPALAPRLPAHWCAMEFKFHYQGKKYSARITHDKAEIEEA